MILLLIFAAGGGINWGAVGGICAVLTVVAFVMRLVFQNVTKWRTGKKGEKSVDDRIMTTLFGKDATPPYPAIEGLVAQHADLVIRVGHIEDDVKILLERTIENGGSSLKDQLNRIEQNQEDQKNENRQTA